MALKEMIGSPCFFGITLQQGTQLIAAINIALGIIFMLMLTIYCIYFEAAVEEATGGEGSMSGIVIAVWVILAIVMVVNVAVHFLLLLKGAAEKNPKKIKSYLITAVVLLVLGFILGIVRSPSLGTFFIAVLTDIPIFYQLWVIFCFYKEIMNVDQYTGEAGGNYNGA